MGYSRGFPKFSGFCFLFGSLQLENRGARKPLFRLQDMLLFFTTLEKASGVLAQLSDRSYFNLFWTLLRHGSVAI